MDEPLAVGVRTVTRAFVEDRHSQFVLAKVLQRLADASDPFCAEIDSVQDASQSVPEVLQFEETLR